MVAHFRVNNSTIPTGANALKDLFSLFYILLIGILNLVLGTWNLEFGI